VGEMKRIYAQLEIDQFNQVEPQVQAYFDQRKDHKTNPFSLSQYMEVFDYPSG